jgi:hypothetical protein
MPLDEDDFTTEVEAADPFHTQHYWLMAIVCYVLIGVFFYYIEEPINFDPNSPDFNPLFLIPAFLFLVGTANVVRAKLGSMRAQRFGRSRLVIEGDVYIGGRIKAKVITDNEVLPTGDWDIRLRCIETIQYTRNNQTRTEEKIIWEEVQKVKPHQCSSRSGVPVDIAIPESCRKIINSAKGAIHWVIFVRAALEGVDFKATFGIRVLPKEPIYQDDE